MPMKIVQSLALTSNNKDESSRVHAKAPSRPRAMPISVIHTPWAMTCPRSLPRWAPRAIRMPISWVRRETMKAISP